MKWFYCPQNSSETNKLDTQKLNTHFRLLTHMKPQSVAKNQNLLHNKYTASESHIIMVAKSLHKNNYKTQKLLKKKTPIAFIFISDHNNKILVMYIFYFLIKKKTQSLLV